MLTKISDTTMVNLTKVSAITIIPFIKTVVWIDGTSFDVTVPPEEILPKLMAIDETNQFWAGK